MNEAQIQKVATDARLMIDNEIVPLLDRWQGCPISIESIVMSDMVDRMARQGWSLQDIQMSVVQAFHMADWQGTPRN